MGLMSGTRTRTNSNPKGTKALAMVPSDAMRSIDAYIVLVPYTYCPGLARPCLTA